MSAQRFYLHLALTTVITLVCIVIMYTLQPATKEGDFASFLITIMIGLSIAMYSSARGAAHSPNPYLFSQKFLGFTGIKIFLCIAIILFYQYFIQPPTKNYLFTFLITYVCFTIFETYVFMKLSKPE